jgi:hypothetical protein
MANRRETLVTTLFERDDRFTHDRIRELRNITESERRARSAIEPRIGEAHPGARTRLALGPALVLVIRSVRSA